MGTATGSEPQQRRRRKRLGIYYTPPELAGPILDETLDPILDAMCDEQSCRAQLSTLRVIDPACGSGHFLLGAWRRLATQTAKVVAPAGQRACLRLAAAALHGIDIDPQARLAGAKLLRRACAQWALSLRDFPNWFTLGDALLAEGRDDGAFDLVIGNPPFVDSESMCAEDRSRRSALAQRYETARGNWDLASLFVERAIQLARPGGRIGLVLPRRLLASDHAQRVQMLLKQQTIESIHVNDSAAFEDANVETVSIVLKCEPAGTRHSIRIIDSSDAQDFAQGDLDTLPAGHWSAILAVRRETSGRASSVELLRVLRHSPRLSGIAFVGDGATTAEAYRLRDVIVERSDATGEFARLINTGTIDPFVNRWGRRPTRYLRTAWTEPVVLLGWLDANLPRRAVQAQSPKVLVAGLAGRIEAVVDDGASLCGKSAVQVIPHDGRMCHALCAWLNSGPINDLYRLLFESRGFGTRSMHLGPRQLEQLPVWRLDDPTHVAAATELAQLSERIHAMDANDAVASAACVERINTVVGQMLDGTSFADEL